MKGEYLIRRNLKRIIVILAVLLSLSLTVIFYMMPTAHFGNWICENGKWITYDNPFQDKPSRICPKATPTPLPLNERLEKVAIKIYLARKNPNDNTACDEVFPVERQIMDTLDKQIMAMEAVDELIKGPTSEEKALGYYSEISDEDIQPEQLTYNDGVITFNTNAFFRTHNESFCQTSKKTKQMSETLKSLPFVQEVMSVNPS